MRLPASAFSLLAFSVTALGCYEWHSPSISSVRDAAPLGDDGGLPSTGGTDGGPDGSPDGSDGGLPPADPPCSAAAPGRCVVATAASISALAVDETHVYWVEYGTHDDLGNHRRDGVLRMSAVGGGTVTTIAEGLPGPNGLGVTSTHAYVFVNAAPLADGTVGEATVRVPLAGGVVEPVLEQGSRRCFACFGAAGDRAIWIGGPGETLWTQTAEDSVPTVLVETGARRLTALANDEAYAYFFTEVRSSTETRQIRRVPLTGGASEDVAAGPPESRAHVLALDGEQLIATTVEHVYGKPLVGGAWTRVLEIPARVSPDRLWLFGPDRVAMRARYPGSAVPVGVFVATIGSNPFEPSVERIDPELRTVRTVPLAVHERFVFWTSDDRSMLLRRAW